MPFTNEDRSVIREEAKAGVKELLDDQGLDLGTHSNDHFFVRSFRKWMKTTRRAAIWATVLGLITYIGREISQHLGG